MMRAAALCCLLASPAAGWEFTPDPVCTLRGGSGTEVVVTYDTRVYEIRLTRAGGWPEARVFSLRFEGPAGLTISTTRHRVEGATLSVTDTGFGNVLDGLEYNARAVARIGALSVPVDLRGAAGPVARFRDCPAAPVAGTAPRTDAG
jgi:hypothetical protein